MQNPLPDRRVLGIQRHHRAAAQGHRLALELFHVVDAPRAIAVRRVGFAPGLQVALEPRVAAQMGRRAHAIHGHRHALDGLADILRQIIVLNEPVDIRVMPGRHLVLQGHVVLQVLDLQLGAKLLVVIVQSHLGELIQSHRVLLADDIDVAAALLIAQPAKERGIGRQGFRQIRRRHAAADPLDLHQLAIGRAHLGRVAQQARILQFQLGALDLALPFRLGILHPSLLVAIHEIQLRAGVSLLTAVRHLHRPLPVVHLGAVQVDLGRSLADDGHVLAKHGVDPLLGALGIAGAHRLEEALGRAVLAVLHIVGNPRRLVPGHGLAQLAVDHAHVAGVGRRLLRRGRRVAIEGPGVLLHRQVTPGRQLRSDDLRHPRGRRGHRLPLLEVLHHVVHRR